MFNDVVLKLPTSPDVRMHTTL